MDAPDKETELNRSNNVPPDRQSTAVLVTGTVKWFSNSKGYGFISTDDSSADIFVHFSAISTDGYRSLKKGQKVRFELGAGPKGNYASNIQPISEAQPRIS